MEFREINEAIAWLRGLYGLKLTSKVVSFLGGYPTKYDIRVMSNGRPLLGFAFRLIDGNWRNTETYSCYCADHSSEWKELE